jgi:hypothetical protein
MVTVRKRCSGRILVFYSSLFTGLWGSFQLINLFLLYHRSVLTCILTCLQVLVCIHLFVFEEFKFDLE